MKRSQCAHNFTSRSNFNRPFPCLLFPVALPASIPYPPIMQLSAALMSLLSSSAEPTTAPIAIGLQCDNVHLHQLSASAQQLVAQALQDSFQTSYALHDNGDSFLADVQFDQSHATKESLKWNGTWNYGCRLCPNDDDSTLSAPFAAFVADLGCSNCAPTSMAGVRAWENALTTMLRATNHAELKKTTACQISLHDPEETIVNVEIGVKCDNTDFAGLGAKASGFSVRALEDSYNKVHEMVGDNFLAGVYFESAHTNQKAALKWNGTWNYGCRLCPNDDDSMLTSFVGGYAGQFGCSQCHEEGKMLFTKESALHAWEAEYTAALLESQFSEFVHAKDCKIDIVPVDAGVVFKA
ncbi:hypothetical protein FisN_30Hu020 [Fistulifera solaris]|uniref:Uncharacterized protein n=1 Tax=Fistulifera solaris TaxID=1519565 RepID=A0A1Z5K6V0_FISSO|nr:hypothetical protein FisN_30Hu020 [Fistulifera solaris]|eukprot:GAX21821.1 hypothetical protein FisN_30Hu020 [Fistulifera solaris]